MKFTNEKELLSKALGLTTSTATAKQNFNIPILQNIKIEVKNNKLSLTGTDLDTSIKSEIEINSLEEGSITVPAQLFFDIVKKASNGSEILVDYIENENIFNLTSGKSTFKLPCLEASGFPVFEDIETKLEFDIEADELKNLIDKSKFAISLDENRYYLNGMFLHLTDNAETGEKDITAATTDGYKLVVIKGQAHNNIASEFNGIIIPKKTLDVIRKVLDMGTGIAHIAISKTKIKIIFQDTVLVSKLIDAEFPDYKRVIPMENDKILTIEKKFLFNAIDRVGVVVMGGTKGIKLNLSKNNLVIEAENQEGAYAKEELEVDFALEDKIEIGFNAKYFMEILSQVESDLINIYFKDSFTPIIIKGSEEASNTFVLMPVRV